MWPPVSASRLAIRPGGGAAEGVALAERHAHADERVALLDPLDAPSATTARVDARGELGQRLDDRRLRRARCRRAGRASASILTKCGCSAVMRASEPSPAHRVVDGDERCRGRRRSSASRRGERHRGSVSRLLGDLDAHHGVEPVVRRLNASQDLGGERRLRRRGPRTGGGSAATWRASKTSDGPSAPRARRPSPGRLRRSRPPPGLLGGNASFIGERPSQFSARSISSSSACSKPSASPPRPPRRDACASRRFSSSQSLMPRLYPMGVASARFRRAGAGSCRASLPGAASRAARERRRRERVERERPRVAGARRDGARGGSSTAPARARRRRRTAARTVPRRSATSSGSGCGERRRGTAARRGPEPTTSRSPQRRSSSVACA